MTRVVSIYLPDLADGSHSSRRSSIPPEQAIAVIARSGSKRWVSAADAAARKAGVHVGMPREGTGAVPRPDAGRRGSGKGCRSTRAHYALGADALFPIVAVDGIDGIVMDTEGADHLQGGELPMRDEDRQSVPGERSLTAPCRDRRHLGRGARLRPGHQPRNALSCRSRRDRARRRKAADIVAAASGEGRQRSAHARLPRPLANWRTRRARR